MGKTTARKSDGRSERDTDARYKPGRSKREGRTTVGGDGSGDRIDELIEELISEGRMTRQQAVEAVEKVMGGEVSDLKRDKDWANLRQDAAVDGFERFLSSDEMKALDYSDYAGDVESQGALATADQRSRDAQYSALDKLQGWTNQELTAEERFMMETARQQQEQDMRAAREAALRSMAARGQRSGAAEMAAVLGGAQQTQNARMLGDLGAQANASRRALDATQLYGNLATDISEQTFDERFKTGTAADDVAKFNKQLRTDYDTKRKAWELEQQELRFGRQKDVTDRRIDQGRDWFDRSDAVAGRALQGSGQQVNALTGGGDGVMEALKVALGAEEAEKARAALQKKKSGGWIPDDVPLIGGL